MGHAGAPEPPSRVAAARVTPADLWRALRALAAVLRDPDRTDLIGEFIASLAGQSGLKLLAGVDWESLLPLPLAEVRRRLCIDAPVPHRKLEPADIDALRQRIRRRSLLLRFLDSVRPA